MTKDFLQELTEETNSYLCHHGILGQRWGVRRYQNKDGSLTSEGRKHYGYKPNEWARKADKVITDTIEGKNDKKIGNFIRKLDSIIVSTLEGKNIDKIRDFVTKAGQVAEDTVTGKNNVLNKLDDDIMGKAGKVESDADVKNVEYNSKMKDSGWDVKADNYGGYWVTQEGKLGNKPVNFWAEYDARYDDDNPSDAVSSINNQKKKYEKEYLKVISTCREAIAKDMYDTGLFDDWNEDTEFRGMTRDEFKKALPISSVTLRPNGEATIFFNDGKDMIYLMGDHVFDFEYSIDDDKVTSDVRLEG